MRDFSDKFGRIHMVEQVVIERWHDNRDLTPGDIDALARLKQENPDAYEMAVGLAYYCHARVQVYRDTGILSLINDYHTMVEKGKIPTDQERNYAIIEEFMQNPRNTVSEAMMGRQKLED